jgi:hypothetical protein
MKTNDQPTLSGIRIWTEPQPVPFNALAAMIAEASAAGFEPVRMTTDHKRGEYVVTFQRMTEAQADTIGRIVGNARLGELKPADAPQAPTERTNATAGSVDAAWRAVVAKHLRKTFREPSISNPPAMDLASP